MSHLDPVGRLAPSSLDVSRAAAVRHAHVSALHEPVNHPAPDRARVSFTARVSAAPTPSPPLGC